MEDQERKLSTEQLMVMLGRKDIDIEILATENNRLKNELQKLEQRNQELHDENLKLGGGMTHGCNSFS